MGRYNRKVDDVTGFVIAELVCLGLSKLHFATLRKPDRNIATRLTYRWWSYWVMTPPFGYSQFDTPEAAIKFEAWGLAALGAGLAILF
jgi:hypothetical protein